VSGLERFGLYLVQGLAWGSLYALIALGYTMVYGVLRLINFAHGDLLMVGAYIALFSITSAPSPACRTRPCEPRLSPETGPRRVGRPHRRTGEQRSGEEGVFGGVKDSTTKTRRHQETP